MEKATHYPVIVIGGGQAGLSTGYYLSRKGVPFLILDANQRIGDAWRKRWDSLRLFSFGRFNALPGLPFPTSKYHFPTKDEMADYLEQYARHFQLPVRLGSRVDALWRDGNRYKIKCGEAFYTAEQVVVAMSNYQYPRIPALASGLDPGIVQLHSSAYKNPSQLQAGPVLIVGAGNSGAEIAMDLCSRHKVFLAGPDTGHVPFIIENRNVQRFVMPIVFRLVFHRLLTTNTFLGRRARPKVISKGVPLIRLKPKNLVEAGIERLPRVKQANGGRPELEDGKVLDVNNIIWCTGFHPGFSWIELPIFKDGEPQHERGVVHNEPGMYFVGLHFLFAYSSPMIQGVGRDAKFVVEEIKRRLDNPARRAGAGQEGGLAQIKSGARVPEVVGRQ